jgi:hypothetical protein
MFKCTDIVETEKVIVDFQKDTITWKPMMFNPKDSIKFLRILEGVNDGSIKHYLTSDFN